MTLLFSIRPRNRVLRSGYLFCPRCRQRTPGQMFLREQGLYLLGFIPFGSVGESAANYLKCDRCSETFAESGDWAFDFGDHAEPKTWKCLKCGEENTSERFHCRRCGRRV